MQLTHTRVLDVAIALRRAATHASAAAETSIPRLFRRGDAIRLRDGHLEEAIAAARLGARLARLIDLPEAAHGAELLVVSAEALVAGRVASLDAGARHVVATTATEVAATAEVAKGLAYPPPETTPLGAGVVRAMLASPHRVALADLAVRASQGSSPLAGRWVRHAARSGDPADVEIAARLLADDADVYRMARARRAALLDDPRWSDAGELQLLQDTIRTRARLADPSASPAPGPAHAERYLGDARRRIEHLRADPIVGPHPALDQLEAMVERTLSRLQGRHTAGPRGHLDHPDYAELGRIDASMSLLDRLRRSPAPTRSESRESSLRW